MLKTGGSADTIFFAEDVLNTMSAILLTNESLTAGTEDYGTQMYRKGFNACLAAMSVAFGVDIERGLVGQIQPGLHGRGRGFGRHLLP